jgi:hypothetical protein
MSANNYSYVAFDTLGNTNPKDTDYKYYLLMRQWAEDKRYTLQHTPGRDKVEGFGNAAQKKTLEMRIKDSMVDARNFVLILSSYTQKDCAVLSYEIGTASDVLNLPFIVVYVDYTAVARPQDLNRLWPAGLEQRINSRSLHAIHIPFVKEAVVDAIGQFSYMTPPPSAVNHYNFEAHITFGCLGASAMFVNKRRGYFRE